MARFLFATMPAAGHVTPGLPIVRALVDRGHDVHWYTGETYRDAIEAAGATHRPIRSAYDFGGLGIDDAFPELTGLTGLTMVRQAMQRVFIDNGVGMLRDLQAIIEDFPADVAVSEALFVATRWLHELGGPPWATLGETMLGTYSRDTAPFGPGLFPLRGPLGRARNLTLNAIHRRVVFGPVTARYEQARGEVGLAPLGQSFLDTLMSPFLYLQGTVPSFEYPRGDLPPHVHFIGPLLPPPAEAFVPPEWWPELESGRRVVLVTQGTVANDPRLLIAPTLRALADEPVLVIATTGAPVQAALGALGGTLPPNARLEPFVPYAELLPHVSVLVTNGGYGGLQQALAHGVPIVVAGATEDKPETAARVAWSGAGVRIKTQSPAPERVRDAVTHVLAEPSFRGRAAAISAEMAAYDAPATAARLLEALVRTRRPVAA
ncbi:glycosyltransferase [Solirubrobacter soli]|uniref:glycosyltransferase n=1 Tax=Solirubrobacter soli TaxID=363832 RepID=UPI0004183DD8|nr:nucleotide disphospho-sugar-binding domain-containing protein [Solirubrobacter soli]